MKKIINNLVAVFFIVVFCFLTGEAIIRIFYRCLFNYNMEMWRYAAELKKPLPYDNLPFHHFPNKQGSYYGVDIKTNSLGFRDYEYSIEKPSGKKRILFLGDSFTLGWGVPFDHTFSKQLEATLNKKDDSYQVINMGIGNYNSIMEVELFKLKGLMLNPDLVILMYFINDAEPTPKRMSALGYFFKKHSYLYGFLFDRYSKLKARFNKNFSWQNYYSQLYSRESANLSANKKAIKELFDLCEQAGIKVLVVNIPELHKLKDYPFSFAGEYIKSLALEADVPFLDMLNSFVDYGPELLWVSPEDSHANVKTNTIIAGQIYKKMQEDNLI